MCIVDWRSVHELNRVRRVAHGPIEEPNAVSFGGVSRMARLGGLPSPPATAERNDGNRSRLATHATQVSCREKHNVHRFRRVDRLGKAY